MQLPSKEDGPDSGLFPSPYYGPEAIPRAQEVQQLSLDDFAVVIEDWQQLASPLGVVVGCLLLYTRLVRGESINPFKWVGFNRKGPRKRP